MKQKSWVAVLLSVLLSACIAFLGLFGALELTFFDSGYLLQCIDKAGYVEDITNAAQAACQGYAMSTGLNTVVLDGYLDPTDIRSELNRSIAERYRNSEAKSYRAHFPDLAERAKASLTPEEQELETPTSLVRFNVLQDLCETTFQEITRPPFDAALSCVLQYRAYRLWAYLVLLVLGIFIYFVLCRVAPDRKTLQLRTIQSLCGGALALAVLGALLLWALPFKSWMPAENLSYPLFCTWWSGFAVTTATAGLLILAAGIVWAVWSGTHPAKNPDEPENHNVLPGTDVPAGNGSMNAPAAERTINLSRALVGNAESFDAPGASDAPGTSNAPGAPDASDRPGTFPGM